MATLDANKFFDIQTLVSEIKSLKQENQIQDASIVRVVNSFTGLENSLIKLEDSTNSFVKLIEEDSIAREQKEKANILALRKEKQRESLESKTTISAEPFDAGIPKKVGATSLAAGIAAAMSGGELTSDRGDGVPMSGDGATASAGVWRPLLDLIASGEGSWESLNPNTTLPGATQMTISEVARRAGENRRGENTAVGRYQFTTLRAQATAAGLNPDKDLFTPENQDKIAVHLLEVKRDGRSWLSGRISDEAFSEGLALEWGALKSARGTVLPGNSGKIGFDKIKPALEKVRKNYSGATSTSTTTRRSSTLSPQASSPMGTSVASASVASSSKTEEMGKTDAPVVNVPIQMDSSEMGQTKMPLLSPAIASVPMNSLVPMDSTEKEYSSTQMDMVIPDANAAKTVPPNILMSINPVVDANNIDSLLFQSNWGIVV